MATGQPKVSAREPDQSLKRLGLPYVDVFYHHRMDKNTPLEESVLALDTAVKSGRALYAGLSNYDSATRARRRRFSRSCIARLCSIRCAIPSLTGTSS